MIKKYLTGVIIFQLLCFLIPTTEVRSEQWSPKIKIKNGSTGKISGADHLKLISLAGGMTTIKEIPNPSGEFQMDAVEVPEGSPILIQVIYKNANYNKMVPPAPEFRNQPVEIVIYETTSDPKVLDIKSIVQITREERGIRFLKLYLIYNNSEPPRTYSPPEPIEFYIQDDAVSIEARLNQPGSGMGIPLNPQKGKVGYQIGRPILPGQSDLMISYFLENTNEEIGIIDHLLFEDKIENLILINPPDMEFLLEGGGSFEKIKEVGPDGMLGYKIKYPASRKISFRLKGGEPIRERITETPTGRKIVNGNIFQTSISSLVGYGAVLALLFSLSFLFVYRKPSKA
ncbi:MAG: hypothetical protein H7A24_13290 [Leptospiraceae bacterium]|nr:hypothetical protein [Leptospiraceae bacterium]MCP5512852.1 hypothetical protein [Leptospiraceae bacterium]